MHYIDRERRLQFEEKYHYDKVCEFNKMIGSALGFKPASSYAVCNDKVCCYSPKYQGECFELPEQQKAECDRYLEELKRLFTDEWITKEGYQTTKLEYWPPFHQDWNHLMEAAKRIAPAKKIEIDYDIYTTWERITMAVALFGDDPILQKTTTEDHSVPQKIE